MLFSAAAQRGDTQFLVDFLQIHFAEFAFGLSRHKEIDERLVAVCLPHQCVFADAPSSGHHRKTSPFKACSRVSFKKVISCSLS